MNYKNRVVKIEERLNVGDSKMTMTEVKTDAGFELRFDWGNIPGAGIGKVRVLKISGIEDI